MQASLSEQRRPGKLHSVYVVTCHPTGRKYVGVSCQPRTRFTQHARTPPRPMRADATRYAPFKEHFGLEIIKSFVSSEAAQQYEAVLIQQLGTRDAAKGYNTIA
eukprot:GHRQ01033546.1.p3 GENE.GHRQ01033546.1~~GHRQ01033546.1.p3  ORF type:complete len:104 (+),score=6.46 GHRQ01033546.1:731-1042(+)